MPIVVVANESNFAELRPRLFEGRVPAAAAGEAADAIREANPHADLDALEPGTVLVVPETPRIAVRSELSLGATAQDAVEALANAGKQLLEELAETGKKRDAAAKAERKRQAKALDDKAVEAAAKKDKRLASDLKSVRAALADEEELAKERTAALKKAQAEWTAGLDALEERLGPPR